MSKESIKTSINTYIKENGNMAITGQILNSVMNEMVEGLASEEELATKQDTTSLVTDLAAKVNALSLSDKAAFLGQIGAASEESLKLHENDNTRHITADERAEWNAKQDAISDLATIRSGASKGATALQSYTETDPIYTADKPSIALKTEIPDVSGKADKATTIAGYGITDAYTKTEVDNAIAAAITTTLNTAV